MGELIAGIVAAILAVFRALFGTDRPQEETVEHPEPDIEVTDGKTDQERLGDLGL